MFCTDLQPRHISNVPGLAEKHVLKVVLYFIYDLLKGTFYQSVTTRMYYLKEEDIIGFP